MSFLGSLFSGGLSLLGGLSSNKSSAKSAARQMEYQSIEADKNRAWEEKQTQIARDWEEAMSNSAHQRQVRDLRSAGLNPILSGTGGHGASTPSVAAPSSSAPQGAKYEAKDVLTPAVASAMAYQRQTQEIDNLKAQEQNTKMDTVLKSAQTNVEQSKAPLNLASEKRIMEEIKNLNVENQRILADLALKLEQAKSAGSAAEIAAIQARVEKWAEQHNLQQLQKVLEAGGSVTGAIKNLIPFGKLFGK